jgi:hypothetical protein
MGSLIAVLICAGGTWAANWDATLRMAQILATATCSPAGSVVAGAPWSPSDASCVRLKLLQPACC